MAQATKTAVTGSLDSPHRKSKEAKPTSPIGDHSVKLTVEVHYALEKLLNAQGQKDLRGGRLYRDANKDPAAAKKRKNPMDDYRNTWAGSHDLEVTMDTIADLYATPVEFSIYELARAEDLDSLRYPSRISGGGGTSSRLGSVLGSTFRLHAPRTLESRRASVVALNKRRFLLENSGMPSRERFAVARRQSSVFASGLGITEDAEEVEDSRKPTKTPPSMRPYSAQDGRTSQAARPAVPTKDRLPRPNAPPTISKLMDESSDEEEAAGRKHPKGKASAGKAKSQTIPTRPRSPQPDPRTLRNQNRPRSAEKDSPHPHHYGPQRRRSGHGEMFTRPRSADSTKRDLELAAKSNQQGRQRELSI
ncbi:hypothetical protein HK097_000986, partial [Rhizophlyctis rosea]